MTPALRQHTDIHPFNSRCKTLYETDYLSMQESRVAVMQALEILDGVWKRMEHPHRYWEYGMAYNALHDSGTMTLLDVGGGGSVFAPMCAMCDIQVTQIDAENRSAAVSAQSERIGRQIQFINSDFFLFNLSNTYDAVTCISVLEHIPKDQLFFQKLLTHVSLGGVLVVTVDFHPSGEARCRGHLRTYNKESLMDLIGIAKANGFHIYSHSVEYDHYEENVNNYTFASLILKREER